MEGWWGWRFGTGVGPVSEMYLRSWPREDVWGIICTKTKGTVESFSTNISLHCCVCYKHRRVGVSAAAEIIGLALSPTACGRHMDLICSAFGASSPGAFPFRVHHHHSFASRTLERCSLRCRCWPYRCPYSSTTIPSRHGPPTLPPPRPLRRRQCPSRRRRMRMETAPPSSNEQSRKARKP
jgi:hypothetical protein